MIYHSSGSSSSSSSASSSSRNDTFSPGTPSSKPADAPPADARLASLSPVCNATVQVGASGARQKLCICAPSRASASSISRLRIFRFSSAFSSSSLFCSTGAMLVALTERWRPSLRDFAPADAEPEPERGRRPPLPPSIGVDLAETKRVKQRLREAHTPSSQACSAALT